MFLTDIYNEVLYKPLFNALVFLYENLPGHDIGIAIIVLTIIIRVLLIPISRQSIKSQKAMQELQPKINEIKNKYKNDREKQSQELIKFYKENKINPFSSCLPLLIQFPILIAIYQVFKIGLTNADFSLLYSFIHNPVRINPMFLGFIDLSVSNLPLAMIAGIFQFIQGKMLIKEKKKDKYRKEKGMVEMMGSQMTYMMPIFTVFIAMSLPSGLTLYWITTTLFSIVQQYYIIKSNSKFKNKKDGSK